MDAINDKPPNVPNKEEANKMLADLVASLNTKD